MRNNFGAITCILYLGQWFMGAGVLKVFYIVISGGNLIQHITIC